jgi:hypothetical protein
MWITTNLADADPGIAVLYLADQLERALNGVHALASAYEEN